MEAVSFLEESQTAHSPLAPPHCLGLKHGMSSLLFALFLVIALTVQLGKFLKKKASRNSFQQQTGNHPDRPLKINRFDQMEDHLRASRCPCGGVWMVRHEGSKNSAGVRLRVLHAECTRCESETDFFFDLTMMQN